MSGVLGPLGGGVGDRASAGRCGWLSTSCSAHTDSSTVSSACFDQIGPGPGGLAADRTVPAGDRPRACRVAITGRPCLGRSGSGSLDLPGLVVVPAAASDLSLIHISEPTRHLSN